jgi:putative tryptophan/tyrosine transport system substrate-binding protein
MRRREFILALGGAAAWATPVLAQARRARPLIAWISGRSGPPLRNYFDVFTEALGELGYTEGRDFDIVTRGYAPRHQNQRLWSYLHSRAEKLDFNGDQRAREAAMEPIVDGAAELVQLSPDIIVAPATIEAVAVKKVTSNIPIVVPVLANSVEFGLVTSERQPGGNLTGIAPYLKGLPSKQLELAREVVSGANQIGLVCDMVDPKALPQRPEIEATAKLLNIEIVPAEVWTREDIEPAFRLLATQRVQAVIVEQSGFLLFYSEQLAKLAAETKLPTVYGYREHVQLGGLISYGVNLRWCFRRAAYFVDRILKGSKPADLPVEFPTIIELVINLRAAKALGLSISPMLLARADEVIE